MIENNSYALVIGGSNIDFVSVTNNQLIWHDKNPGKIQISLGGVGRNISENLAKLDVSTKLISLVGDDIYGQFVLDGTKQSGVDVSCVHKIANHSSSVYFSLMDNKDDMVVAISDMDIMDKLTPDIIKGHLDIIENAKLVILDTNLPQTTLHYLLTSFSNTRFFVDTVSVSKCTKIQNLLVHIDTLKPNHLEAQVLTGITIETVEDAFKAIDSLIRKGVKQVFLSFGAKGLVYGNGNIKRHIPAHKIKVENAAGAGDSMMASIAYGDINDIDKEKLLVFANAAAALTLTSSSTIHPQFSVNSIKKFINTEEI